MVATLGEGQSNFSRLVEIASQGEEVVITVNGEPRVKLIRAEPPTGSNPAIDLNVWRNELEQLREKYSTGKSGPTVDQILAEDRTDRL